MKARDIKPGERIDGWTVTTTSGSVNVFSDQPTGDAVVLLTMEYSSWARNPARLYEDQYLPLPGDKRVTETRRIWYLADEEV